MARSSTGRAGRAGLILILILILASLATASCGYVAGAMIAWAACGDAGDPPHCADGGTTTIVGGGLLVRDRLGHGQAARAAPLAGPGSLPTASSPATVGARVWAGVIDVVTLWLVFLLLALSPLAALSGFLS